MFEYYRGLGKTKKQNLDGFVRATAEEKKERLELAGRRVVDTPNDMASIFLPNDKLLASAGILPVYYWLIRNVEQSRHPRLREFLVRFGETRRRNRQLVNETPDVRLFALYVQADMIQPDLAR